MTNFDNLIPQGALDIIEKLQYAGYEAYLVGGCVRDLLLGTTPNDWDICTNALPESVYSVFEATNKVLPTGLKHGTVTVLSADEPYEITTYRVDGEYTDGRRPSDVTFTGQLLDDLARRDFTINAMAYNSMLGVVDPFGGREDLANKRIRCVGDPEDRFNEDSLRILRALRFSSCKGFRVEPTTSEAIKQHYKLTRTLSAERVLSELLKLLTGKQAYTLLMTYTDVITFILPELAPMVGCTQNNPHHKYDVWEHTCATVSGVSSNHVMRLAALFHDAGKPATKTTDDEGIDHFYKHALESVDIAESVLKRLRASNTLINEVLPLVKYHDAELPNRSSVRRLTNKIGQEQMHRLLELKEADAIAQTMSKLPPKLLAIHKAKTIMAELEAEDACFKIQDLAVKGSDLIAVGFKQGKQLGQALNTLLTAVLDEELPNDKEVLLGRAREILSADN